MSRAGCRLVAPSGTRRCSSASAAFVSADCGAKKPFDSDLICMSTAKTCTRSELPSEAKSDSATLSPCRRCAPAWLADVSNRITWSRPAAAFAVWVAGFARSDIAKIVSPPGTSYRINPADACELPDVRSVSADALQTHNRPNPQMTTDRATNLKREYIARLQTWTDLVTHRNGRDGHRSRMRAKPKPRLYCIPSLDSIRSQIFANCQFLLNSFGLL